ncbi:hypothetical protein FA15DRAFT_547165, partial [Coprinopsis marcescibilis]
QPFRHHVILKGRGKEEVLMGTFDRCALIQGVLCTQVYEERKDELGKLQASSWQMRMADGSIVPLAGVWAGKVEIGGLEVCMRLEVFNSGGNWEMLVGKPMLRQLKVVQDYAKDVVTIKLG